MLSSTEMTWGTNKIHNPIIPLFAKKKCFENKMNVCSTDFQQYMIKDNISNKHCF